MPVWLLKIVINFAINFLVKKLGTLDATKHVETALLNATPLPPDPLPPMHESDNPNTKDHYGGL